MSLRLIGVGGEPGVGKSHLVGSLAYWLGSGRRAFACGLVRGSHWPARDVFLLGTGYGTATPYPGTDGLSMAVQRDLAGFLQEVRGRHAVVFEGDRLFNAATIATALDLLGPDGCRFYVLRADAETVARRRTCRHDTKPASFLKGRRTKYAALLARFPGLVRPLDHDTPEQASAALALLAADVAGE